MPLKKKYNARFPPARIKKIMQMDEEIGKVAAPVPVMISRVLEHFMHSLLDRASLIALDSKAKTLQTSHLSDIILKDSRFGFLRDTVHHHCKNNTKDGEVLPIPSSSSSSMLPDAHFNGVTAPCTPPPQHVNDVLGGNFVMPPSMSITPITSTSGSPSPSIGMSSPSITKSSLSITIPSQSFTMSSQSIAMSSPSIAMSLPSIGMSYPSMGMHSPSIGMPSPSIGMPSPSIGIHSPSRGMLSPSIGMPGVPALYSLAMPNPAMPGMQHPNPYSGAPLTSGRGRGRPRGRPPGRPAGAHTTRPPLDPAAPVKRGRGRPRKIRVPSYVDDELPSAPVAAPPSSTNSLPAKDSMSSCLPVNLTATSHSLHDHSTKQIEKKDASSVSFVDGIQIKIPSLPSEKDPNKVQFTPLMDGIQINIPATSSSESGIKINMPSLLPIATSSNVGDKILGQDSKPFMTGIKINIPSLVPIASSASPPYTVVIPSVSQSSATLNGAGSSQSLGTQSSKSVIQAPGIQDTNGRLSIAEEEYNSDEDYDA